MKAENFPVISVGWNIILQNLWKDIVLRPTVWSINERNGLKNPKLHRFHQYLNIKLGISLVIIEFAYKYSNWLKKIKTKITFWYKELNFTQELTHTVILLGSNSITKYQTVSCEIKFAHAHVRARPHVCDVRAKRLSKRACDVRACGRFKVRDVRKQFRTFLAEKRA